MNGNVTFTLTGSAGVRRRRWPVTLGVPFPEGVLGSGKPLCLLDPDGSAVPLQYRPLATWRADGRHVKWMLIDFLADMPASGARQFTLTPGAPPAPAHDVVTIAEDTSRLCVDTGTLQLALRRNVPDFWERIAVKSDDGWRELVDDHRPGLLMRDQHGATYDSRLGSLPCHIEVEEAGSVRACIKVSGYHVSEHGIRFCPYILRVHTFAGRSDLRIRYTHVFDQEPEDIRLASAQLVLPLALGSNATGAVGTEDGSLGCQADGTCFVHQEAVDRYVVGNDKGSAAAGDHAPGWARQTGDRGSVCAVIRDMWQTWPKGFTVGPAGLCVDIWPDRSAPLDYRNPFREPPLWLRGRAPYDDEELTRLLAERPEAPLDLHFVSLGGENEELDNCRRLRDRLERFAPGRPYAFSNTDIARATGSAATTGVWVSFHNRPLDDAACRSLAQCVQEPALASAAPSYVCATGAAGDIYHAGAERFADVDKSLEKLFDLLVLEPQRKCSIYGHLMYGELINGHNDRDGVVYRAFCQDPSGWGNVIEKLGVFNNESQDIINNLWALYLRTGARKHFEFAETKSRHTECVDFVHSLPHYAGVFPYPNTAKKTLGQMHYHSVSNWSGPYLTSHSLVSGIMRHYWLTGHRGALDVALGLAECILRNQTPAGVIRASGINRELTGPLASLLAVYQVTWEDRLLRVIRNSLEALRATIQPSGNIPRLIRTDGGASETEIWGEGLDNRMGYPGGMLCYVIHDAWQLFGEGWMRDWIVQLSQSWIHDIPCDGYTPEERVDRVLESNEEAPGAVTLRRVADGWYWNGYDSRPNYHFDPVVALAYKLTRDPQFLGYLHHRTVNFPAVADDIARCLSVQPWNFLNHVIDSMATTLSALAEADEATVTTAYQAWCDERAARGFAVYRGPRLRRDAQGRLPGETARVVLKPLPHGHPTPPPAGPALLRT